MDHRLDRPFQEHHLLAIKKYIRMLAIDFDGKFKKRNKQMPWLSLANEY